MPKLTSTVSSASHSDNNLELTFIELQRVGPDDNFEIIRKLGWGSYVSSRPENAP
jgi:hypothetical protein